MGPQSSEKNRLDLSRIEGLPEDFSSDALQKAYFNAVMDVLSGAKLESNFTGLKNGNERINVWESAGGLFEIVSKNNARGGPVLDVQFDTVGNIRRCAFRRSWVEKERKKRPTKWVDGKEINKEEERVRVVKHSNTTERATDTQEVQDMIIDYINACIAKLPAETIEAVQDSVRKMFHLQKPTTNPQIQEDIPLDPAV